MSSQSVTSIFISACELELWRGDKQRLVTQQLIQSMFNVASLTIIVGSWVGGGVAAASVGKGIGPGDGFDVGSGVETRVGWAESP
jgi:hypothetical protein